MIVSFSWDTTHSPALFSVLTLSLANIMILIPSSLTSQIIDILYNELFCHNY